MAAELRRAKKTFNVVSTALIDQLLAAFPNEPVLTFFRGEIDKLAADPKTAHVPAANFFATMNVATKIQATDSDEMTVVGELVVRHDERLFGPECGVVVPALEALGLKAKWPKLSAKEREMVWGYLGRLATHAAQVVVGTQMSDPKMKAAIEEIVAGKETGGPNYAAAAAKVRTVIEEARQKQQQQ